MQNDSLILANSFRALYRALLRQATYLPDPAARIFARQRIIARFRAYNPKRTTAVLDLPPSGSQGLTIPSSTRKLNAQSLASDSQDRWSSLWRKGIQSLHGLERASLGCRRDLLRVLFHTYGRTGKRRHELLNSLKTGAPQPDTSDLVSMELSSFPHVPSEAFATLPHLDSRIEALLRTQQKAKLMYSTRPKVRNIEINVPRYNIWLRPTPVKRVRNTIRKWYAEKLNQVLPSLPAAEWQRLGELARGERKWDGHVKPRKRRDNTAFSNSDMDRISLSLLQRSLISVRVKSSQRSSRPHVLTDRYMQRLYAHVFVMCARMDWDKEKKAWSIEWGADKPKTSKFTGKMQELSLQQPRPAANF